MGRITGAKYMEIDYSDDEELNIVYTGNQPDREQLDLGSIMDQINNELRYMESGRLSNKPKSPRKPIRNINNNSNNNNNNNNNDNTSDNEEPEIRVVDEYEPYMFGRDDYDDYDRADYKLSSSG